MYAVADTRLFIFTPDPVGSAPVGWTFFDNQIFPATLYLEPPPGLRDQHSGGRNIVFCDGHSEAVKREKLFEQSGYWSQRWYTDHQPHPERWPTYAPN